MTTLYEKTLNLFKNRPVWQTHKLIENETGIGRAWLKKFSYGEIENPSVNKIQTLYEYLTDTKLDV